MKISDFLPIGKENGISMYELSICTDLPERLIRKEILKARISGELICSGDEGYYLPANEEEIKEYVSFRKTALKTSYKALQPFLKSLKGSR